jgi:hypothetical protein
LYYYPQIAFEKTGPHIRGDAEEMQSFGWDNFHRVMVKAVTGAFRRFSYNAKGSLHLERVRTGSLERGYRFSPRVFTRHSIQEIAKNIHSQSFILRFANDDDKRLAFQSLASLADLPFKNRKQWLGSHVPTISVSFNIGDTLRALMKIGVNLIGAYCKKTPVNPETFRDVIQFIRGEVQATRLMIANNGFVRAEDIKDIKCEGKCHSFRLVHLDGWWRLYASFFGGRIGALVHFPGPNWEKWNSATIVAPVGAKTWTFKESHIIQPMNVKIEWNDSGKLCPSLKVQTANTEMRGEIRFIRERR